MFAMHATWLLVVAIVVDSAFSHGVHHTGTPPGIAAATDCALRQFAYQFGTQKLPMFPQLSQQLAAALQLGACGYSPPEQMSVKADATAPPTPARGGASSSWAAFVDPGGGSDDAQHRAAAGTIFKTIQAAVEASRSRPVGTSAEIILMEGTHFVSEAINLTAADSRLTIRSRSKILLSNQESAQGH